MEKTKHILVAEDDASDSFFLQRAFTRSGIRSQLHFVRDGQEVVDYLKGEGGFAKRQGHPFPELLLLDLKMPRLNGFDVLRWIRKQPGLKRMLVVIFSSSQETEDVDKAYDLGANSYLTKPHDLDELQGIAERVKQYWLELNRKPDCSTA
jgi:CheY-like chemotaxis protein